MRYACRQMRWSALFVCVVLGVAGVSGPASADKVKTNQSAKLYSHPGEAGTVLTSIKSGQAMTVLAKEGRWLKVRVNGRTGYVPRSKVDMPDDGEVQRNTRRRPFVDGRSTGRGFGGEAGPDDRVGADATGDGGGSPGAKDPDDEEDGGKPKGRHGGDKGGKGDKGDKGDKGGKPRRGHKADPDDDAEPSEDGPPGGKGDKDDKDNQDDNKDDKGDKDDGDAPKDSDTRPIAHVSSSVKAYEEASKSSAVAFKAKPDQKLFVEDKKGKWTEVSLEEGDVGWVLTSQLDMDDTGGGGGIGKRLIDLRARVGLTIVNQGIRSVGSTGTVPDNYNVGSAAAVLALGGQYLMPYKTSYVLGGEIAYQYAKASPGVAFMGSNIGFSVHDLDVRAMAGYDLHKSNGMTVFGRLGYRYQGFLVSNVLDFTKNTARIPSEVDKGPAIGVALWIPRITPKIGIRASLDAIFYGVNQTQNLEDGSSPSATGLNLGGAFTYHWKSNMDLQATYDLNYASVSFGAPTASSMRGHAATVTSVSRTDIFHTIAFGITRAF